MKVICVDDAAVIMNYTVSQCRQMPGIDEVTGFTRPAEALVWVSEHPVDLALLDIDMPEMSGIALARAIKQRRPEAAIIFLTAYPQYAYDAFKLHASGYLLKPVNRDDLEREIRYALTHQPMPPTGHLVVRTFGTFDVFVDGVVVTFARRQSKELLAYLVDRRGGTVTRAEAFAALWEDDSVYDRSRQKQLDVIIRSLRETLNAYGIGEMLIMQRGTLCVNTSLFDCDLYRFLDGDPAAINAYRGEYMSSYAWATLTEAYLTEKDIR